MNAAVFVIVAATTFVVMEPVTAWVHRRVMHGRGIVWHASHHRPPTSVFERNDLFPLVFSAVTVLVLVVGVFVPGFGLLVPIGVGVTAYGLAYLFVHDVLIHDRVPGIHLPPALGRYWRDAHNVHHVFGREPYGFLAPIVPSALRERAAEPDAPIPDRVSRARR